MLVGIIRLLSLYNKINYWKIFLPRWTLPINSGFNIKVRTQSMQML